MVIIAQDETNVPRFLLTDDFGALIDTAHSYIHRGLFYIVSRYYAAVPMGGTADMRIQVGATLNPHITISVAAGANATINIYEGTTYTAPGTALIVYSRNRETFGIGETSAFHTPTVLLLGPSIYNAFIPGGSKQSAVGSVRSNSQEWVFEHPWDYLIRVTNVSAAAADYSIEAEWYEV
jgi:hypothetical protein